VTCRTHEKDEKCIREPDEKDHLKDEGVDGRTILECMLEK